MKRSECVRRNQQKLENEMQAKQRYQEKKHCSFITSSFLVGNNLLRDKGPFFKVCRFGSFIATFRSWGRIEDTSSNIDGNVARRYPQSYLGQRRGISHTALLQSTSLVERTPVLGFFAHFPSKGRRKCLNNGS